MIKELIRKLNVSPTFGDYRQCRYEMVELAENIARLEIELARMKEEMKIYEAERAKQLKEEKQKITIKEIESIIRKELEEKQKEYLEVEADMKIKKAQYEAVDKFLKAVDSSLYYLNNSKNDI